MALEQSFVKSRSNSLRESKRLLYSGSDAKNSHEGLAQKNNCRNQTSFWLPTYRPAWLPLTGFSLRAPLHTIPLDDRHYPPDVDCNYHETSKRYIVEKYLSPPPQNKSSSPVIHSPPPLHPNLPRIQPCPARIQAPGPGQGQGQGPRRHSGAMLRDLPFSALRSSSQLR